MATYLNRIRALWGQWGTGTTGCRLPVPPRQSAAALPGNLKQRRIASGWTVNQLAVASHLSESTIREIERDIAPNPTLVTLLALARALGVGVEALVEGI